MDWKATLAEIAAERRKELGERPSLDEMIALRAGELSAKERERLLERAAWDPEVARDLLDVIRFPSLGDGAPVTDAADQDRSWQAMRARLRSQGVLPERPVQPPPSRRTSAWGWLPLAASFGIGLALAFAIGQVRPREAVRINLPVIELVALSGSATDVRRGGERTVVPAGTEGIVLTLAAPGLAPGSGPYDLEIRRGRNEVFRSKGLVPGEGGVFVLFLPRERLEGGAHELLLRDSGGRPVASFRLEVGLAR